MQQAVLEQTSAQQEVSQLSNERIRPTLSKKDIHSWDPLFLKLFEFPNITVEQLENAPQKIKDEILVRNRIINTDSYNRTMNHLSSLRGSIGKDEAGNDINFGQTNATFTLQMRRSPFNYLVVDGINEMLQTLYGPSITQAELDFASDWYEKKAKLPFFDKKMWQDIIDNHDGRLPIKINGVKDGTVLIPGEPVFTVEGPMELVAHFEQVFHRVFYATLVATRSHALLQILGDPSRFLEVGKRGAFNDKQHLVALRAVQVGGGFKLTSNDGGLMAGDYLDVGTMGHRYLQTFDSVENALGFAIENLDSVVLLVDLIDSYDGMNTSFKLKQEYHDTGKKIWMRLDSGDIKDQVRYFLKKSIELGMTDPDRDKVVVEGIDSLDEIIEIEKMIEEEFGEDAKKRVIYGAGGLIVSQQTSRSDASSGFKISDFVDFVGKIISTMKWSDVLGKISYPGKPKVVNTVEGRVICQQDEELIQEIIEDLFYPLFEDGEILIEFEDALTAHDRAVEQFEFLLQGEKPNKDLFAKLRGVPSPKTWEKIRKCEERFGLNNLD